ncbi:uncharacterized protein isoform X1 [Rhodnius prolixus]|uniref:uncharacterized protein isoform X1 n=1 Tax=Rhodnius prolixus TaxID=13249 RepID=UPI003D18B7D3
MNLKNSSGEESIYDSANVYDLHGHKLPPDGSVGTGEVGDHTFEWKRRPLFNNGGSGEGGAQQIYGCSCPNMYCQKCASEISTYSRSVPTEPQCKRFFSGMTTWSNIKQAVILIILSFVMNKLFYLLPDPWTNSEPELPFYNFTPV